MEIDENLKRFLSYVKVDTQSDEASSSVPSAAKELNLSRQLIKELKELGIPAYLDEYGIVYGKLEGEPGLDKIGLNSHVDTALESSGENVKPQIVHNYDGGEIRLNENLSMSPKEFPSLKEHIGDDLIVTSGDTLLGADDKAGVAVIMAVLAYYAKHPEKRHHTICFAFTTDEEIGRGPEHFDVKKFGADYAYTVDGGCYREVSYENFNAAHADIRIEGVVVHPGESKGKMVNAASLGAEFDLLLPRYDRPQYTEGREGFVHLISIAGDCGECRMHYIIREHDRVKLDALKKRFFEAKETLLRLYPQAKVEVVVEDDYRNMKEGFDKDPRAVKRILSVFEKLGYKPDSAPIRGGTDGAGFSFMGCPTPNLGTGSYNHHGPFEYLSVGEFNKMIQIVTALVSAEGE